MSDTPVPPGEQPDPHAPPPPPPPPPPGGYGAPPPAYGGATPPPPGYGGYGGYGAPPTGPGQPYGQPAGQPGGSDVGSALGWAWATFQANAGQAVLSALIYLLAVGAITFIGSLLSAALTSDPTCAVDQTTFGVSCDGGTGFLGSLVISGVTNALTFAVSSLLTAGLARAALQVADGGRWELSSVLSTERLGAVLITSLLLGALTFVGVLFCFVGAIVVAVFTYFTMYFVVDQGQDPVQAVRSSVDLVRGNLGSALLWVVVAFALTIAGVIACIVGILVAMPVVVLGTAYTYRRLAGRPIAA